MDLIDRQDAIKAINDVLMEDEQYKVWLKLNIKNIKPVDAIPFKWTPCSERLPEEVGTYLVTINYHGNTYVCMDNFLPSGWGLTGWTGLATILAWAKVPEPYKGEENDSD